MIMLLESEPKGQYNNSSITVAYKNLDSSHSSVLSLFTVSSLIL